MRIKEFLLQDGTILYVGETEDIKAVYKSIARNKNTNIYPLFCDKPKYSKNSTVYGLNIDTNRHQMTIINSDTCMFILLQQGFLNGNKYPWILIKERLPEDGETVIISTKGHFTTTVSWNQGRNVFEEVCNLIYTPEFVTAWMPYPHTYNTEKSVTHKTPYYPVNFY